MQDVTGWRVGPDGFFRFRRKRGYSGFPVTLSYEHLKTFLTVCPVLTGLDKYKQYRKQILRSKMKNSFSACFLLSESVAKQAF